MNVESKFHLLVATWTVVLMYYVVTYGAPLLTTKISFPAIVLPAVTALTSIGAYKTTASLLRYVIAKSRWIRGILLGSRCIEGTWIGKFTSDDGVIIYTVEHFEQTLGTLKIRGEGYSKDGKRYAAWNSVAENIDEQNGVLSYTYTCDKDADKSSFQGVAKFLFQRGDATTAPDIISGYSADLTDGTRTENTERRIVRTLLPFKRALERAIQEA